MRQIKTTMHDGLLLPRLFRQCGYRTDLTDLTDLATCRMYRNARQVWQGLAKNATEGLAAPVRILPISLLLFLGQIVPFHAGSMAMAGGRIFGCRECLCVGRNCWSVAATFYGGIPISPELARSVAPSPRHWNTARYPVVRSYAKISRQKCHVERSILFRIIRMRHLGGVQLLLKMN